MKLILVAPPVFNTQRLHLGLYYLSAAIQNYCDINVIEFPMSSNDFPGFFSPKSVAALIGKKCSEEIMEYNPDLVGITVNAHNFFLAYEIIKRIKGANNNIKIFIGGPHATLNAKYLLSNYKHIDFIILGEGETILKKVIYEISKNKFNLNRIDGVAFRDNFNIVINKRNFLINYEEIPNPDIDRINKNKFDIVQNGLPIITSRGCNRSCKFCTVPKYWGNIRYESLSNLFNRMDDYINKFNVSYFSFNDDNLTADKNRLNKILIYLNENRIEWDAFGHMHDLTINLLNEMTISGCKKLFIGVESLSYRSRRKISKDYSNKKIFEVINYAKINNLKLDLSFIIGFSHEFKEDINETLNFALEQACENISIGVHFLTPYEFDNKEYSHLMRFSKNKLMYYLYQQNLNGKSELPLLKTNNIGFEEMSYLWLNTLNKSLCTFNQKNK